MMERAASCLMTRFSRFNSLLTTQIRTHTTTDAFVVMAVVIVAVTVVATRTLLFNLVFWYNSTISNAHGYIYLFHHIHYWYHPVFCFIMSEYLTSSWSSLLFHCVREPNSSALNLLFHRVWNPTIAPRLKQKHSFLTLFYETQTSSRLPNPGVWNCNCFTFFVSWCLKHQILCLVSKTLAFHQLLVFAAPEALDLL